MQKMTNSELPGSKTKMREFIEGQNRELAEMLLTTIALKETEKFTLRKLPLLWVGISCQEIIAETSSVTIKISLRFTLSSFETPWSKMPREVRLRSLEFKC